MPWKRVKLGKVKRLQAIYNKRKKESRNLQCIVAVRISGFKF